MKILFVTRLFPHFTVRTSGTQDQVRYIEALSQNHDVSLISFVSAGQEAAVEEMKRICSSVICVPYDHYALLPRLWRAMWRVLLPKVFGRNVSIAFARTLNRLSASEAFDVVVVEGTMALYASLLSRQRRTVDEIDIYSRVTFQEYRLKRNQLRRLLAWFEWKRTQLFEIGIINKCDGAMVRSEADRSWLHSRLPGKEIAVIPPWFEGLSELLPIPSERPEGNKILFMGALMNPKNIEAAIFFVDKVLPLIKRDIPDATLLIVGDAPTKVIRQLGQDASVIVTGEVPALKPYYEQCAVNIVPLLIGGGIIVKTLNGMAAGRPTVSTPMGVSGIEAQPGRDLLVEPVDPQRFAKAVVRLLTDDVLWMNLSQKGKQFVREKYDWTETVDELEAHLFRVANVR